MGSAHTHTRLIPLAVLVLGVCAVSIFTFGGRGTRDGSDDGADESSGQIQHLVKSMMPFTLTCSTSSLEFTDTMDLPCEPKLHAGRPVRVSIPSVRTYWSASLHEPYSDTIVPVYRSFHRAEEGWFAVPFPGEWRLIVRAPEVLPDFETDIEPSWCMAVVSGGPDRKWLNQSKSVFPAGWDYCRVNEPNGPEFMTFPPRVRAPDEGVIIRRPLKFVDGTATRGGLAQTTELLASSVYGPYAKALAKGGSVALGYWRPRTTIGSPPQTLDYQPEPQGCPQSFQEGFHQEDCKYDWASYAWHPLSQPPGGRILVPAELERCKNERRFMLVGDSVGHGLYRGMSCGASGYAQLKDPGALVHAIHHAVTLMPLFAPLDMRLDMLYDDFISLLGQHHADKVDYVWHFGTWMVSYVPSGTWRRGLRRLAQFCHRHSRETGSVHHFTLTTAPHWDPAQMPQLIDYGPRWQTVSRTFAWNRLLLEMSERYEFKVIDLFSPTSSLLVPRPDNCHWCDSVSYELGHIVFNGLC